MNFLRTAMLGSAPVLLGLLLATACTVEGVDDPAPAPAPSTSAPKGCPAKDPSAVTTGPTVHEGDVEGDEVWTAEGSPHVVNTEVNVRNGAKLTIAPCALVQLVDGATLNVAFPMTPNQGELVAVGTAERPIKFEGQNGARWNHVYVHAPGTARFAYVTFGDGGGGDTDGHETIGATGDGDLPRKPVLFVDHVTITGSRGAGIRIDRGGAFTEGSKDLVITQSGALSQSHPYPLEVGEQAVHTIPTGTYTGNGKDEIKLTPEVVAAADGFQEDSTMRNFGVPYHVGDTPEHDGVAVGNGAVPAVLTLEAGVKLLFEKKTGIHVATSPAGASAIRALGTATDPVIFTSASATPAPGDWRGFYFNGGTISAQNKLDHVRIEYTGSDCACGMVTCSAGVAEYEAAIIFAQPPQSMFLTNAVIAHGAGHGVVQGYDGTAFDWAEGNTFDDVAGCPATLPRNADTSCPDPMPACK